MMKSAAIWDGFALQLGRSLSICALTENVLHLTQKYAWSFSLLLVY